MASAATRFGDAAAPAPAVVDSDNTAVFLVMNAGGGVGDTAVEKACAVGTRMIMTSTTAV